MNSGRPVNNNDVITAEAFVVAKVNVVKGVPIGAEDR
jgi:hypothetical protein